MSLVQRARESGKCSPSLLLAAEQQSDEDGFEEGMLKVLDTTGFRLRPEAQAAEDFMPLLEKAERVDDIQALAVESKTAILVQRRCLLLVLVGSTNESSASVTQILSRGYLSSVKKWLDDILAGSIGGIDLLLHLLTNIATLPVTKSEVKSSGMGKIIGSLEKHRLCTDTPNASAIKERIQIVKENWNSSVKAKKSQDQPVKPQTEEKLVSADSTSDAKVKRPAEPESPPETSAKRAKLTDESKKASSSFSTLLKKVAGPSKTGSAAQEGSVKSNGSDSGGIQTKKVSKRVKWADHFGGALSAAKTIDGDDSADGAPAAAVGDTASSWSDRKKRDRLREKELLANAKKAKLLDDDEDDDLMERLTVKSIQPTAAWRMPALLPNQPDITRPELVSQEKLLQDDRMRTIPAVRYTSEMEVSSSPDPLTDIEQALDMTSQSSVALTAIPFFVPQQPAVPDPSVEQATLMGAAIPHAHVPQQPPVHTPYSSTFLGQPGATPEFLQSLGLPLYLVGQDTQALQTVANSPGLLSTLVDATGQYDQQRLLSLVQTLSASGPGRSSGQQQMQTPAYLPPQPVSNMYGQSPAAASLSYGGVPAYSAPVSGGFRSNSDAGNLHISGFGPGTTQTDIIQLFSPYVRVDEVFMKGSFAFVNTSDPVNAQIAREALSGTLLCGAPVRINPAQRKTPRESSQSAYGPASHMGPPPAIPAPHAAPSFTNQRVPNPQAPMIPSAIPTQSVDDVRDDRGNPATKNLFVAGYGPTTTEEELRAMFSQQAEVIGVVLKGAFSFVNTLSREQAVACRQVFGGTMLNGGVLRINFAKETGRLGTSFDLTYGKETGPNARRPRPPGGHGGAPPPPSAYGGPPNMYGPPSGYGGGGGPSYYGP